MDFELKNPGLDSDSPDILGRRCQRWDRARRAAEEKNLSEQLRGMRIGAYKYLNAAPLIYGIEDALYYGTPRELLEMMACGELDAALLSIIDVLKSNKYKVLDGIGIASLGEVKSVALFHKKPLEEINVVYVDPASVGSGDLLWVILAERGYTPEIVQLPEWPPSEMPDYLLLIGDKALQMQLDTNEYQVWDLGLAWYEMTRLPFVHAIWAIQPGADSDRLKRVLRAACKLGLSQLDEIIRYDRRFTMELRRDYLEWHLHYYLGVDEKRAIAEFGSLLKKHGRGPVFEPQFVS